MTNNSDNNDILAKQADEIIQLRADIKKTRKRRSYSRSKLRKHFAEVKRLREEFNFSFPDIALWLRKYKRTRMSPDGVRSAYNRINDEF